MMAVAKAVIVRAAGVIGVAAVAVSVATLLAPSPPLDLNDLASRLGESSSHIVHASDVRWEPSGGVLSDLLVGRFVLFLGRSAPSEPRDVFRARVRISPEGHPLSVRDAYNLTSTPLGDDHALVVRGTRAAYATAVYGQEQSVTLLDLTGEGALNTASRMLDRITASVSNWQTTGAWAGLGRVDLTLDQPAERVGLSVTANELDVALADNATAVLPTRHARIDATTLELSPATVPGLQLQARRHVEKPFIHWAVDTVRAISFVGPAPIAWLEEKHFALRDAVNRAKFKMSGASAARVVDDETSQSASAPALEPSLAAMDLAHWPPAAMRSMWNPTEPGEGEWSVPTQPWIKQFPSPIDQTPPSMFYRTFVRPDEERSYSKVVLVAMDMRQLDLQLEAGSEDPKPLTGPPGAGRIPRDPAVYTKVAAAFNGGFKTEHGSYGMMLKKRILLPPVPATATVVLTRDARFGLGTWGTNKDVGGIKGLDPADIVSFRQNLDPLLDNDKVNPSGRTLWGFTLPGTTMQTERSGICVTHSGHLIYAWGDDVSATTLGKAMKMASCAYGMHLDMNPHHTGFIFTNIAELKGRNYKSELLDKQMEIDTARYIEYAPKDFFYLTLHDPTPPSLAAGSPVPWEPAPGVQPAPAWLAGIWHTTSGDVDVVEIEPGRAAYRIRAGTKEPDAKVGGGRNHELNAEDSRRVVLSVSLGLSEEKHVRGLVTDGRMAVPMSNLSQHAVLVADESGALSITPLGEGYTIAPRTDAAELPLLFADDTTTPRNGRIRAALGISPAGRVYLARVSRPVEGQVLADVLKRAGCTRAVVLERGKGAPGTLLRAGTEAQPRALYEDTTLSAIGKPLLPRGFRFEATASVEAPKKK
jgi:hypothetical protein